MARFILLCATCFVFRGTLRTHALQSDDSCSDPGVRAQDVSSLLQSHIRHQQPAASLQLSKKHTDDKVDANTIGYKEAWVGVDTSTNSFHSVPTGSLTEDYKFNGAATVGTKVVFAPRNADMVGVFDTKTNVFSNFSTGSLTGYSKFFGAATVGTKVVFADMVGVFDTETN